jgi:hypothetical protein
MMDYIKTEGCRRVVLGKYFDPAETIRECHDSSSSGDDNNNDDDNNNNNNEETEFDSDSDSDV